MVCEAMLSTTVSRESRSVASAYEITPESLIKKSVETTVRDRIEATSHVGTDKLALEIDGPVMKLMTKASLDQGNATAAEFDIYIDNSEQVVALGIVDSVSSGSANVIVVNKKTGFAVWTKARATGLLADVPDSQTHYLRCK